MTTDSVTTSPKSVEHFENAAMLDSSEKRCYVKTSD